MLLVGQESLLVKQRMLYTTNPQISFLWSHMASWLWGLIQGGGLIQIFLSRMGAYSRGGLIYRGVNSRIYGILCIITNSVSVLMYPAASCGIFVLMYMFSLSADHKNEPRCSTKNFSGTLSY